LENETARQGPDHCSDLHTHAQCPREVGAAYSSAPESSTTAEAHGLHAAAGRAGLAESAARCGEMLAEALGGGGRIDKFRRDGWAPPWPVGPEMLCYMLSHEPHHPDRCVSSRISSDFAGEEGGVRNLELGKALERARGA